MNVDGTSSPASPSASSDKAGAAGAGPEATGKKLKDLTAKERGNYYFKRRRWDDADDWYTQAIEEDCVDEK